MKTQNTSIPSIDLSSLKGWWWLPGHFTAPAVEVQTTVPTSKIPPQLLARLESLRPVLTKNGTLQYRHDNGIWRIRYYEYCDNVKVRRSINIGRDDHLACEIELWLEKVRREQRVELTRIREAKLQQRQQKHEKRIERLTQRLYIQMMTKGGRDRKAWAWQQYKALANDPIGRLGFVMLLPSLPAPKMGRPYRVAGIN